MPRGNGGTAGGIVGVGVSLSVGVGADSSVEVGAGSSAGVGGAGATVSSEVGVSALVGASVSSAACALPGGEISITVVATGVAANNDASGHWDSLRVPITFCSQVTCFESCK